MEGTNLNTCVSTYHTMTELDPPEKRKCHRCGRREAWDDAATSWTIETTESTGSSFCIHEWNITGAYAPVRD